MDRMGLVGLALFIVAVTGLWHFFFGSWAIKHRENPIAGAAVRFWPI